MFRKCDSVFFRGLDKGRFARKSSLEHMHNVSCFATYRTGELSFEEENAVRVDRLWSFSIFPDSKRKSSDDCDYGFGFGNDK